MLFIDRNLPVIESARQIHSSNVVCRIMKRVTGQKCSDSTCRSCKSTIHLKTDIPHKLYKILGYRDVVEMVVDCVPEEQLKMVEMFWHELINDFNWEEYFVFIESKKKDMTNDEYFANAKFGELYAAIVNIFGYDTWFQNSDNKNIYDAYSLASNLNRNTCTYCNRVYTSTMKSRNGRKVMRPTFDHWYQKSKHPLLALSFYNLIPSCSICNSSVKGVANFSVESHLHPYIDINAINEYRYSYDFYKSTNTYSVKIKTSYGANKVFATYNGLKLIDIYNSHHSDLADMLKIKQAYSETYIENMLNSYPNARLSHEEVYRLAFGTELESSEFHKRPLSKFKKDILGELGLLSFLEE